MSVQIHDDVTSRLRRSRQRYSPLRRQIVDLLHTADRPQSIPDLLAAAPDQAQSSVYRNLNVLEQAGVVRRLTSNDDVARYELAEDVTGHHHHHLVCTTCGRIEDFDVAPAIEEALHAAVDAAQDRSGFRDLSHQFELHGTCADCA